MDHALAERRWDSRNTDARTLATMIADPEQIKSATRIGKVDVDHGETSCRTPDAKSYIETAVERNRTRAAT
jgi:hypothetical protein